MTARLLEAGAMLSVSARVPAAGVQTVRCVWAGSMLALGRERGVVNRGVVCMGEGCRGVSGMGGWVEGGGCRVQLALVSLYNKGGMWIGLRRGC